ncbi:uncharacterized protein LOC135493761 [Lineus longissimus]|uniref:uncharacterized protein LOC135493761 n=1 Tax=Lineus longissimus TaxID=88925 RepID=UPI00315C8C4F
MRLFWIFCFAIGFWVVNSMDNGDDGDGGGNGGHGDGGDDGGNNGAANEGQERRHLHGYSLNQRLDYVDTFRLHHAMGIAHARSCRSFAVHHRIHPRTFSRWLDQYEEMSERRDRCTQIERRRRRIRQHGNDEQAFWADMENQLNDWFIQRRQHGIPVSGIDLQSQAAREYRQWWTNLTEEQRQQTRAQRPRNQDFRASDHWLTRFKERKRISHRRKNKDTRTLPDNAMEIAAVYRRETSQIIQNGNFHVIINMDETFVNFDMVPKTTMATTGSHSIDIRSSRGNGKIGCTVTLAVSSDGRKLPAEVNFRGLDAEGEVIAELRAHAPQNVRVSKPFH